MNIPQLMYPPCWVNLIDLGCFQFGAIAALTIPEKSDGVHRH